jgi:uncharacterized protein YlxP (DUF503 family)
MVIGALHLEFRLHGVFSLKEKRRIAASIKQKLRNRFNVAVAETDAQDSHGRLVLGVVTVSSQAAHAEGLLHKAIAMVEEVTSEELVASDIEIFGA